MEHFLESIGVIVKSATAPTLGQFLHIDVNAPEEFMIGVMSPAPLTRVAKFDNTMDELGSMREKLELPVGYCLKCDEQGVPDVELTRYYAARLLMIEKANMDVAIHKPFSTYTETIRTGTSYSASTPHTHQYDVKPLPDTPWEAVGTAGSIIMLGGGIPHYGPPSFEGRITRLFILARVTNMASPYMGYSQMRACEVELFFACAFAVTNPTASVRLMTLWKAKMHEYQSEFVRMKVMFNSSPMFAVTEPLVAYVLKMTGAPMKPRKRKQQHIGVVTPAQAKAKEAASVQVRAKAATAILAVLEVAYAFGETMMALTKHKWPFKAHDAYTVLEQLAALLEVD